MARVVILGDKNQLQPIEAGRAFSHLQENGLRTVNMEDVVRQKNKRHVKGVVELSKHQVREAFQTLQKEIHEVPRGTLNAYAVNLRHEMNDPAIIVNTNAQCKALNEAIKSRLSSKATQGLGTYKSILKAFHLSKAQKKTVGSYEGAYSSKYDRSFLSRVTGHSSS